MVSDEQESPVTVHGESRDTSSRNPNNMVFGLFNPVDRIGAPSEMEHSLLDIYYERVHTLFRVLHWPSTRALLQGAEDLVDVNIRALKSAIYFASVCSLLDHELDGRPAILSQYRQRAEEAFIDAGLLTTNSFMVLQAFVIYLVSIDTAS